MRVHLPMLTLVLSLTAAATGATINPGLAGNTSFDGWAGLTSANYPGYGSFPGSTAWPAPIASNQAGSGDASFNKTAGNGYPASGGIYVGGFGSTPNVYGGSFAVSDATALTNLANVVFQIQTSESSGYDFYDDLLPTLSYNGGSQSLAVTGSMIVSQTQNGTFTNPETGVEEPIYVNVWLFQWDLSSLAGSINNFAIDWSSVQHSQISELRLDQSDVYASVVPEPASLGMLGLGALLTVSRRKRNK